jgi:hypothetical protein
VTSGSSHRATTILLALLLAIAGVRIIDAARVVGLTHDEPAHLACGMEWLDRGTYLYEPLHPPLARVSVALSPWLDGRHSLGQADLWSEGYAILLDGPSLRRTLLLARLGVLPFFFLAILGSWWWGNRLGGLAAGIVSALLASTLPSMLAHGALATTDMPFTGMMAVTTALAAKWFQQRSLRSSIALGLSLGLTLLVKHSALLFLPVAGLVTFASWMLLGRKTVASGATSRRWAGQAALVALTLMLVVWAGFRFSIGTSKDLAVLDERVDGPAPVPPLIGTAKVIPAPEYIAGVRHLKEISRRGHPAFLLGEVGYRGWWYFFPVAFLVKTPIPFLLLTLAGIVWLGRWPPRSWLDFVPLLTSAGVMLVVLPSPINIGLRHVLTIFPLLAAVAGAGAVALYRAQWRGAIVGKAVVIALVSWQVLSSARAHPNYLTWFNFLPGSRPDLVLVDSDLDWGQDMMALVDTLRSRNAQSVTLAGALTRVPEPYRTQLGFPASSTMPPYTWTPGYVAVDLYGLHIGQLGNWRIPHDAYAWVENYEPVASVGKTIRLYRFPADPDSALRRSH